VGNVKAMPYWSARDQACVIPTYPLKVRIDGHISPDAVHDDGQGDKEYPFGGARQALCALLPVCCFKGPYHWTSTKVDETASLEAATYGFHAPTLSWQIGGQPVKGTGSQSVTLGVTRQTDSGTIYSDQVVTLKYVVNAGSLTVTNDSIAGNFDVVVAALADEGDLYPTGGTTVQGARRVAQCLLPFRGQVFSWDAQFERDRDACNKASDELWKKTHRDTQKKIGPLNPGDLRPQDRAVLSNAGAWVPEEALRATEAALRRAVTLELSHPDAAAQLRQALLSSYGIPTERVRG
ncbi:MAG TPA: hypothetical protein VGU73_01845, partial [Acidimicrobiia bacterium]|nr:hypothetical protein [Acidimicrobiia bacterium]